MTQLKLETLYSKIFHNAVVAIGITDLDGKFILVNSKWCELLGYTTEEAQHLTIKDVTPEENWASTTDSLKQLLSPHGQAIRKQRLYKRKDGSVFWSDLHASAIYDSEEHPIGILGVFVNIDKQITADIIQRELMDNLENLNKELTQANYDLKRLARRDALTGLYNRRVLDEFIAKESNRSQRTRRGFGIAIADIDNFKHINDTYGHECGDLVLKELAHIFRNGIRTTDVVGRWGGEEFLFIFTETSCQGAMIVIERIRCNIEQFRLLYKGKRVNVTTTFGLSFHPGDMASKEMIEEADKAMYTGKKSGKNRVICYQDICTEEA